MPFAGKIGRDRRCEVCSPSVMVSSTITTISRSSVATRITASNTATGISRISMATKGRRTSATKRRRFLAAAKKGTTTTAAKSRTTTGAKRSLDFGTASKDAMVVAMLPVVGEIAKGGNQPEQGAGEVDPDGILHAYDVAVAVGILTNVQLVS